MVTTTDHPPARRRVVYLITDLDLGGTPLVLRDRVRELHRLNQFDITVVSIKPLGPVAAQIAAEGIPVLTLNARSTLAFPLIALRWIRLLRRLRPHVINSLLVHANLLAALAKPFAPRAVYLQELHTVQENPRWHWKVSGKIARAADALLAPSQAVFDKLAPFGSPSQAVVIPNAIDVARFADAVPIPPTERPWPADAFIIGYLGRFDPVKNLPLFLEAIAQANLNLPDQPIHAALIGYGPQESALREQAARLHLDGLVHLLPPTSLPERWLKALDAVVLPSLAEGFGMIVAEAIAAGKPVLAFECPAIRSVVGPDYPLISPPTVEALTLAIASLKKGKGVTSGNLATSFAHVQAHFSPAVVTAAHAQILSKTPQS